MSYGVIRISRILDATNLVYIDWSETTQYGTHSSRIPYTKYNIKETDFRVKTATFTTPQYLDLTTGAYAVLINSKYHENFAGRILDVEYDEDTGLYTYQCQDWSRTWISKIELIITNCKVMNVLRNLISRSRLPATRDPTQAERKNWKTDLSGLKNINLYDQSLYPGNRYTGNPMKNTISFVARDKSRIELIRDIVYSQLGWFDVWFNDRGIIQITPISKTDWENTGLHLGEGTYYNRKFKFSTTNAITGVVVNGKDLSGGLGVTAESAIGLNLTAFFGANGTSISDPTTQNTKNTSTAVKTTTNTTTTNKTMKNPFNNKSKKIIVSADGGSSSFKAGIVKKLKADGWTVKDLGVGPGTHSKSYNILDKSYAVNLTIYNGADPETIKEPVTGWLKGRHEKYGVQLVQMFDTSSWTEGMKPYRYGNFNGYTCNKAWDDNYSGKSNAQARIKDLGAWYKNYYPKVIHVCGPTVSEAYKQFKAGGYLKQKGIKK